MALIEVYHVVADYYPVAAASGIVAGMVVALEAGAADDLNESVQAYVCPASASSIAPVGIAGDSGLSAAGKTTPYSNNLVVNSAGTVSTPSVSKRWTEDRVSDMYDETLSSGKITVYNQGGKFRTDQYYASGTFVAGSKLYPSTTTAGLIGGTEASANSTVVGICINPPAAFPSGVPGTDTEDGSMSLGTFLTFILKL